MLKWGFNNVEDEMRQPNEEKCENNGRGRTTNGSKEMKGRGQKKIKGGE